MGKINETKTKQEIFDAIASAYSFNGTTEEFMEMAMKTGDEFVCGIWFAIRAIDRLFDKEDKNG